MKLSATHFGGHYLDTVSAVGSLNPYGSISQAFKLNSHQKAHFESLERPIQSKVATLAAYLYKRQDLLEAITYQIKEGHTFNAETMMMQIVDDIKRVKLDETKMEFYEAIHELIMILQVSNFGDQIDRVRDQTKNVLSHTTRFQEDRAMAA